LAGETTLKIFELNPRPLGESARGEASAAADPEDVIVLLD
jgi:hypothetical protein